MGTDIHAFLEACHVLGYWDSLGEVKIDRNITLFQKMRDISHDEPRFEENPSNPNAYSNKTCSQAFSEWYEQELSIYTSWATLDELSEVDSGLYDRCAAIAFAHGLSHGLSHDRIRLVFSLSN